jgi:methionine sulfoxide reductase heme-binding subunit
MIRLADVADIVGTNGKDAVAPATSLLQDNRILWFVNRGTGMVLLGLLTLSVLLGVLSTLRATSRWWPRFVTQALHRNISLLALAMLTAHVVTAVVDDYVPVRWYDAFFPFAERYRPVWGSLGTVALDLMLIVTVTSLVRHRLGHRPWRVIHLTAYLSWLLGLIHGLGMGTDQRTTWSMVTTGTCIGLVIAATVLRLSTGGQEPTTQSIPIVREARAHR